MTANDRGTQEFGEQRSWCGRKAGEVLDEQGGVDPARAQQLSRARIQSATVKLAEATPFGPDYQQHTLLGAGASEAPPELLQTGRPCFFRQVAILGKIKNLEHVAQTDQSAQSDQAQRWIADECVASRPVRHQNRAPAQCVESGRAGVKAGQEPRVSYPKVGVLECHQSNFRLTVEAQG